MSECSNANVLVLRGKALLEIKLRSFASDR